MCPCREVWGHFGKKNLSRGCKSGMLLALGEGGAIYKEVCFVPFMLEGSGGVLPPNIFLKFRPSEITIGAFSNEFIHTCKQNIGNHF